ncbi:AMP-binding protein [Mariniflexile litorale]|uniref:AMP-binding protein n=1 Tax=Mariniflexile litorale TaxID=3045158 RepID=A0AAU7EFB1_9FLAO|nr:AMP-binding protein [Mariniflexile sp. KMM 9835]MDQ8211525.1 AMP-binding protein [Mariniflexile sp. KMM 9835]
MEFIKSISDAIQQNQDKNAFCINKTFYTYKEFIICISKIRGHIRNNVKETEKLIGLVTHDDLETYASIIALWLEGKAYVPVNPDVPIDRNIQILTLTEINYVIDSLETSAFSNNYHIIKSTPANGSQVIDLEPVKTSGDGIAYILFTSGSTGLPKGVPITFDNVNALVKAVDAEPEFQLTTQDRCLQMFELTFDFSVVTYLFPILAGACIFTIPKAAIKYFYIFKLIKEQKLTVLTMVPSIINYLRPYFKEINEPHVRYCSFGGGALYSDIAVEWSNCLPNCKIFNYYGPTEFTVYSGFYPYNKETHTKAHNGIVAIGTPQLDTLYLVVDENNNETKVNEIGELCLAGPQITKGYWKDEERNKERFFFRNEKGTSIRYYKTGDLCFKDAVGDYLYVGRADFQVKIRGYRVELSEIEFHAKTISTKKVNMVAIDLENNLGNAELGLAIESEPFETDAIFDYLKTKLPSYMIPMHQLFLKEFPHSINGKIDRKELRQQFNFK